MTCSITNLGECLPEAFFQFVLAILNAPLQAVLDGVQYYLTQPIPIHFFSNLWGVIIYVISIFYGLLFLYTGLNFMISGYSARKREEAKSWLRNTLIMVFLVQSSFLIYSLIIDVNNVLTTAVFNMIDPNTFLLTWANFIDLPTTIVETLIYLMFVGITEQILQIRFIIITCGVILFPIGIFLYFILPLRNYGRAIINFLMICIFSSFFASLIILTGSLLAPQYLFGGTSFLGMAGIFLCVDLLLSYLLFSSLFSLFNAKKRVTQAISITTQVASGQPPKELIPIKK
ncbi:MAG: hypothetical protein ABIJ18_04935 [archaeon]